MLKVGWIILFWLRKVPITKKKSHKIANVLNIAWKVELSLSVSYLPFIHYTCFLKGLLSKD